MLKRLIAAIFAGFIAYPAMSEPIRGWLTGQASDFLQFECSDNSDGSKKCDFIQV